MAGRVFVDTAGNGRPHACYDPGGDRFFTVESLTELCGYGEVYVDSLLFHGIWREFRELLGKGINVYYFTRPWRWRELRRRFRDELREKFRSKNVRKTDFGDAYVLWRVYEIGVEKGNLHKWFLPITMIDVELRPILSKEQTLHKTVRRLERMDELSIEVRELNDLKSILRRAREETVEKGFSLMPWLRDVAERLGIADSVDGCFSLIGLATYIRSQSYHKALRYLGLYRAKSRDARDTKRCQGKARRYLHMLATIIVRRGGRFPPKLKDQRQILRTTIKLMRELGPAGV